MPPHSNLRGDPQAFMLRIHVGMDPERTFDLVTERLIDSLAARGILLRPGADGRIFEGNQEISAWSLGSSPIPFGSSGSPRRGNPSYKRRSLCASSPPRVGRPGGRNVRPRPSAPARPWSASRVRSTRTPSPRGAAAYGSPKPTARLSLPERVLREIDRVLDGDGRVVMFTDSVGLRGAATTPEPVASGIHGCTESQLADLARAAGFPEVEVSHPNRGESARGSGAPTDALAFFEDGEGGQLRTARARHEEGRADA